MIVLTALLTIYFMIIMIKENFKFKKGDDGYYYCKKCNQKYEYVVKYGYEDRCGNKHVYDLPIMYYSPVSESINDKCICKRAWW